jgi:hypothetical protein
LRYILTDGEGGVSKPAYKNVQVLTSANPNVGPQIQLDAATKITRNGPAQLVSPNASMADPDNSIYFAGSLGIQFTGGSDKTEQLSVGGRFTISGDDVSLNGKLIGNIHPNRRGRNGNILFLRFTSNATNAVVDELLRSITIRTVGSKSTADRTLLFKLSDADGVGVATTKITV